MPHLRFTGVALLLYRVCEGLSQRPRLQVSPVVFMFALLAFQFIRAEMWFLILCIVKYLFSVMCSPP